MEEAIRKLLHGFRNFRANYFSGHSGHPGLFGQLCQGQHPKVLVIACSDSRVDPALLTDCNPGDIFVIRNVANLVPPYEPNTGLHHGVSAALEYAVNVLEVEHIIILGHSDCGGIRALMRRNRGESCGEFLRTWLDLLEPAREMVNATLADASEETRHRACEEAALLLGLENLLTFPWIRRRSEEGKLSLHAWYFHLGRGRLYAFDRDHNHFVPLRET